jgi:hypothetical protein
VFAFVKLNCNRVQGSITFRFEHNGKLYTTVTLPVRPSQRWRSWASVRALPGAWRVILEIEGRRLLDDKFYVKNSLKIGDRQKSIEAG